MKNTNWIKLASIYIGTVIGAGFASGQEIIQFFGVYGYKGILGIGISTILFILIGIIIMLKVYRNKVNGYEELLQPVFGKSISSIIETIITLYLFVGFCVMLAGSGAIFYQQFNLSDNIGIYLMAGLSLITFVFSVKGISFVNVLLVPLLSAGIILLGVLVISDSGLIFSNHYGAEITKVGNWLTSSILYVSYNSISAIVILSSLLSLISNRKDAVKGGIAGGLILGILAIFILIPSLILYTDIYRFEIPMLKVASILGGNGELLYSVILWGAMFTTAIASGYGCIRRIASLLNIKQIYISIVFCALTMPLAKIGFSNLVSTLYPLFGYLGFIIIVFLVGSFIYNSFKRIFLIRK